MLPHNTQPVLQPWHCLHVVVYDTPTRYCNVHTFKSGWYLAFHVVLLYHFYFHVHHCCWGNTWWEMHSKFPCHACMNFPAKWKCFPENMIALELAPVEIHRFHLQSRKNITIRRQRMPWEKINTWWYPASHITCCYWIQGLFNVEQPRHRSSSSSPCISARHTSFFFDIIQESPRSRETAQHHVVSLPPRTKVGIKATICHR